MLVGSQMELPKTIIVFFPFRIPGFGPKADAGGTLGCIPRVLLELPLGWEKDTEQRGQQHPQHTEWDGMHRAGVAPNVLPGLGDRLWPPSAPSGLNQPGLREPQNTAALGKQPFPSLSETPFVKFPSLTSGGEFPLAPLESQITRAQKPQWFVCFVNQGPSRCSSTPSLPPGAEIQALPTEQKLHSFPVSSSPSRIPLSRL